MLRIFLLLSTLLLSIQTHAGTVMTIGDSLANGYGIVLPKWLKHSGWLSVNEGVTSSGLISKKPADWSSRLQPLIDNHKPDVVLMSFGANDAGMPIKTNTRMLKYGSDEWAYEYINRTVAAIETAKKNGAYVIWMPIPAFKDSRRELDMAYLRALHDIAIQKTAILKADLKTIQTDKFKSTDGVHYNMNGYSAAVDIALRTAWELNSGT